ncbi:MAG: phage protease, partial [Verrucomicrobiales bacterium]|nr:phage protease [Verrucomicrobiales bacterium]
MLIHNREFQIPADGWFHLAPLGKHPAFVEHGTEPVRVIQVVNTETVQGLVNRFNADKQADPTHALLWDFDHESEDNNKRTEAAGWIEELQIRNDGLWGRGRLSDLGEGAIKGGRYRKTSPVWDYEVIGGGELRNGAEVKPL